MINDTISSSAENGNLIHQSSSDNLTHQQPSSGDNFAQFIRMIGSLSPSERQTLASVISPSSPSSETPPDPYLSTKPTVQSLKPYDRLEEWLTSFNHRHEFFDFTKNGELEDITDITVQSRSTPRLNIDCLKPGLQAPPVPPRMESVSTIS